MTEPAKDALRDAATIILIRRDGGAAPRVLMGQRGESAAFMPSKFVFPGGAVDPADHVLAQRIPPPAALAARLESRAPEGLAGALALAAIRELWEEAGLALARTCAVPDVAVLDAAPEPWRNFLSRGWEPAPDALSFVFRAITPPGRPRRFDARFFMADAGLLADGPDAFDDIDHELGHLSWLTLPEARALDLPFITEVVLAEVDARLEAPAAPRPAPFFRHEGGRSFFEPL
ncbi:NUDIX domain-containing protein [Limibaculum sp. M0105]|uniref:NUDIX domain-containing protein n=1 Tax=Thermohalobaculum xanthum TaxID=2753746 RepID=A0A8J7SF97_9RHOB|nr:NUDIX domain-containing protein [Thermohalobaculum xanthum]MBK0401132.1 NUDIX domain-containing protein [Thermohalobaculum xanthum]